MNWRAWVYDKLRLGPAVTSIVAERIYSSGELEAAPKDKPFIVLRFDDETPEIEEASFQDVTVWVHDEPGSYVRIDEALSAVRTTLEGPVVAPDGVYATWLGDSPDLADDARQTLVRNSAFRLAGRR